MSAMNLGVQTFIFNPKQWKALKPLGEGKSKDVWN